MNFPLRIKNFLRRWNLSYDKDQSFLIFKNRILHILDTTLGEYILENPTIEDNFAYLQGYRTKPKSKTGNRKVENFFDEYQGKDFESSLVYGVFVNTSNLPELVTAIQFLFWSLEQYGGDALDYQEDFAGELKSTISISPYIDIRLVKQKTTFMVYPSGAEFLDEGLISDNLIWLDQFPEAKKHFEKAIRIYASKEKDNYRELLDNLRLALEELIRSILNNSKSFENQKDELLSWLGQKDISQPIINMFANLLFQDFRIYQNELVKHSEYWLPLDVEFMIYLSGTFARLLIQLNQESGSE